MMSNSAERLHDILTKCREKNLRNQKMMEAWGSVLVPRGESDDMLVMNKVGKVFTLPITIGSLIKRFDDLDQELYLGWRPELTEAFRHVNFHAQFHVFAEKLTDVLLISIKFCSHELEKRLADKNLDLEELQKLRDEANQLFEAVLSSSLPPGLYRYLLDHLYRLIESIDDYLITGAVGVERAFNETIGTIITQSKMAEGSRTSEFGDKFWRCVSRAGVILEISKTMVELGQGVSGYLQLGT